MNMFAQRTYEAFLTSTKNLVPSGSLVAGYEINNLNPFPVTVSGVPWAIDPNSPYPGIIGVVVPASGTVLSQTPFTAPNGLKFSTSAGSWGSRVQAIVHVVGR